MKKVKTVKLYNNTKGYYFNYGRSRIYLYDIVKSDSDEHIGIYGLTNVACIVITNINDIEDKISYYVSIV